MKKIRLFTSIISLFFISFILTISICYNLDSTNSLVLSLMILLVAYLNLLLRKQETNEIKRIIFSFTESCDTDKCLQELNNFMKSCFFTKKQKQAFNLYLATVYLDKGELEKAKEILLDIDEINFSFNKLTKFVYLKNWCDYFFYNRQDEKMKYTLLKMKDIIDILPNNRVKFQFLQVYQNVSAKYAILISENLNEVYSYINAQSVYETSKFQKLNTSYITALIDLRKGDVEVGIEKLKKLALENKKLFICYDSKRLIKKYEEEVLKLN